MTEALHQADVFAPGNALASNAFGGEQAEAGRCAKMREAMVV
jgi:hypothetical protein